MNIYIKLYKNNKFKNNKFKDDKSRDNKPKNDKSKNLFLYIIIINNDYRK